MFSKDSGTYSRIFFQSSEAALQDEYAIQQQTNTVSQPRFAGP